METGNGNIAKRGRKLLTILQKHKSFPQKKRARPALPCPSCLEPHLSRHWIANHVYANSMHEKIAAAIFSLVRVPRNFQMKNMNPCGSREDRARHHRSRKNIMKYRTLIFSCRPRTERGIHFGGHPGLFLNGATVCLLQFVGPGACIPLLFMEPIRRNNV